MSEGTGVYYTLLDIHHFCWPGRVGTKEGDIFVCDCGQHWLAEILETNSRMFIWKKIYGRHAHKLLRKRVRL